MSLKKFPEIFIRCDNFEEDVKVLLRIIRPKWNLNELKSKRFYGGLSNILFGVHCDPIFTQSTDMILIRICGKIVMDRDKEMAMMVILAQHDLAGCVWGQFANGCAYQYIHGTMLELNQLRDDRCVHLIIEEMVKLHTLQVDLKEKPRLIFFDKIREIVDQLPTNLKDPIAHEKYVLNYPSKEVIVQEIDFFERNIVSQNYPIAFCHNDILANNLILSPNKDRIHLIDYEYAEYNYCGYDIGNFFNEFAGIEYPDFSLYPEEKFQKYWISLYLKARKKALQIDGSSNDSSNLDNLHEIDFWYKMVNQFALISMLFSSAWAIWQIENSEIEFDYLKFAIIKWEAYRSRKEAFLSL